MDRSIANALAVITIVFLCAASAILIASIVKPESSMLFKLQKERKPCTYQLVQL